MIGEQFGRLTVAQTAEPRRKPSGRLAQRVVVTCDCGSPEREVDVDNLRSGNTTSCGCSRKAPRPARRSAVVAYTGMHTRLNRERGKASSHACVDCGQPAREWSYDHDDPDEVRGVHRGTPVVYSLDVARYSPRCSSCHNDLDRRPRATCKRGHPIDDAYVDSDGKRTACRRCKAAAHAASATCKRGHNLAVTGVYDGPTLTRRRCWVCTAINKPTTT